MRELGPKYRKDEAVAVMGFEFSPDEPPVIVEHVPVYHDEMVPCADCRELYPPEALATKSGRCVDCRRDAELAAKRLNGRTRRLRG